MSSLNPLGEKMENNKMIVFVGALLLASTVGCGGVPKGDPKESSASSVQANGASLMGKVSMSVVDGAGNTVFTDAVSDSTLQLTAGQGYQLDLSVATPIAGASYSLETTQTNVVAGAVASIPLHLGRNSLVIPSNGQGDYSWKLVITAPNVSAVNKFYIAAVQCASPTFTQASLTPSSISFSSGARSNIDGFSAACVSGRANGRRPM